MSAGLDPTLFWRTTPREMEIILRGASARLEREHTARAWLAWHVAALSRVKKLPKFDKFAQIRKPQRQQSIEEQIAMAKRWNMALNRSRG